MNREIETPKVVVDIVLRRLIEKPFFLLVAIWCLVPMFYFCQTETRCFNRIVRLRRALHGLDLTHREIQKRIDFLCPFIKIR